MWDFGWIENSESDTVWKMDFSKTTHAGGNIKNRIIETTILLQPSNYKLRYKSDDSHSYNLWNAVPPNYDFYGIKIYEN